MRLNLSPSVSLDMHTACEVWTYHEPTTRSSAHVGPGSTLQLALGCSTTVCVPHLLRSNGVSFRAFNLELHYTEKLYSQLAYNIFVTKNHHALAENSARRVHSGLHNAAARSVVHHAASNAHRFPPPSPREVNCMDAMTDVLARAFAGGVRVSAGSVVVT